jgi:hypothetical protein
MVSNVPGIFYYLLSHLFPDSKLPFRFLLALPSRRVFRLFGLSDFPELIGDDISEQLNAFTSNVLNQRFGPLLLPVLGLLKAWPS